MKSDLNKGKTAKNKDIFTLEKRSEIMSKIKSKNSLIEKSIFSFLRNNKIHFQKHYTRVVGKPDIAIPSKRKVVFIDSDFWHGWRYSLWKNKLNSDFWVKKIETNKRRDKFVNSKLRKIGWSVMRVWEHDLKKSKEKTLNNIRTFLTR